MCIRNRPKITGTYCMLQNTDKKKQNAIDFSVVLTVLIET